MSLNNKFLEYLTVSFKTYLEKGARSNEKLKVIHSFIADTIKCKLNNNDLAYYSLRNDNKSKELKIHGKYMDKVVDIAICKNDEVIAAVGFKFVMSNYKQNSNNYFENMLGETANIRCNNIPYFQILVLPKKIPYFDKNSNITKWEEINEHDINKYITLSYDNIDIYFHTPVLFLLYIVDLGYYPKYVLSKDTYKDFYKNKSFNLINNFNNSFKQGVVIINDFENFINKICYYIKFKL